MSFVVAIVHYPHTTDKNKIIIRTDEGHALYTARKGSVQRRVQYNTITPDRL